MYNQRIQILQYLAKYGTISSKEAQDDLGIGRLASRINELKKQGYPIESKYVNGINRFGRPTRFKRYWLEVEK